VHAASTCLQIDCHIMSIPCPPSQDDGPIFIIADSVPYLKITQ